MQIKSHTILFTEYSWKISYRF